MELEDAVRTRRTHKAFRAQPVDRCILDELFELARWVPNHRLTNPWRFRVVGPTTLADLKRVAERVEPGSGTKLDRAPTLVVSTVLLVGEPEQDREDLIAAALATYVILLGAHARGLAGYWRTPAVLRDSNGLAAVGVPPQEVALGLLYLGHSAQRKAAPDRLPVEEIVRYLP